jgi:predicted dehydrogenase
MERIALIGAGYWGANIATSFEATGAAEIAWICDVEQARADKLATCRPHARTTRMLDDVLGDSLVSAVAISTPTSTHHMLAKRALTAGKHVFVEKPITASVTEASDLVEAARLACRILLVGHVFEYNSTLAAVKEIIRRGELGELHYFSFERTNLGPVRTDVNALWDLASHDVSIMCDLVDETPVDVTASGQAFLNRGIEDVVFATFSFANGAKAHVHASWLNPRKVRQMAIVGSRKMLVWDDLDLQMPVRVFNKRVDTAESNAISYDFFEHKTRIIDGGVFIPNIPVNRPLQAECEHFLDCIRTGKRPKSDGESGLRVVRALDAAMRSLKNGSATVRIGIELTQDEMSATHSSCDLDQRITPAQQPVGWL